MAKIQIAPRKIANSLNRIPKMNGSHPPFIINTGLTLLTLSIFVSRPSAIDIDACGEANKPDVYSPRITNYPHQNFRRPSESVGILDAQDIIYSIFVLLHQRSSQRNKIKLYQQFFRHEMALLLRLNSSNLFRSLYIYERCSSNYIICRACNSIFSNVELL